MPLENARRAQAHGGRVPTDDALARPLRQPCRPVRIALLAALAAAGVALPQLDQPSAAPAPRELSTLRKASAVPGPARQAAELWLHVTLIADALLLWIALALAVWWQAGRTRAGAERWLERFADLTAAALANAHAHARLREEARLESALREVAAASASGKLDEWAISQLVSDRVADLLGVADSSVWRFDEEWMTLLGCHGSAEIPDFAPPDARYALRIGERDAATCPVGVPIIVEGSQWGALCVGASEAERDPDLESVLGRFADLVCAALANAQAQERLRFRARLEQVLREVASASASGEADERALGGLVAERIADLLDAPLASAVHFTGGEMIVLGSSGAASLPVGMRIDERSTVGRVAQTQATVVVEDYWGFAPAYQELVRVRGGRCVIAVPVFVDGGLWGSLTVMLRPDAIASVAVEILERLAQLSSAALANAQARLERAMRTVASAGAQGDLDEHGDPGDSHEVSAKGCRHRPRGAHR